MSAGITHSWRYLSQKGQVKMHTSPADVQTNTLRHTGESYSQPRGALPV